MVHSRHKPLRCGAEDRHFLCPGGDLQSTLPGSDVSFLVGASVGNVVSPVEHPHSLQPEGAGGRAPTRRVAGRDVATHRRLVALLVGRQHGVVNPVLILHPLDDFNMVCHLRHPLRRHKARRLDAGQLPWAKGDRRNVHASQSNGRGGPRDCLGTRYAARRGAASNHACKTMRRRNGSRKTRLGDDSSLPRSARAAGSVQAWWPSAPAAR